MKKKKLLVLSFLAVINGGPSFAQSRPAMADLFISYTVDAGKKDIQLYWKNDIHENFGSIQRVKNWLEKKHRTLVFAMNGGMYTEDEAPLGLFIEKQLVVSPLNIRQGEGNFYLQPNGVFYLTLHHRAVICRTKDFRNNADITYATQSGPLLVIDGQINPIFSKGSANLNIRNGVGILPDKRVLFAMSKQPVSFYEFANFFKSQGCKQALYLDGLVSRTFLPGKHWIQTDGDFGVIIGVTETAR